MISYAPEGLIDSTPHGVPVVLLTHMQTWDRHNLVGYIRGKEVHIFYSTSLNRCLCVFVIDETPEFMCKV